MTALLRSRWVRFGLLLAILAAMTGATMLAGEDRVRFFISAKLDPFPFSLFLMLWPLVLMGGSFLRPPARRSRLIYAALAMMMASGLFRELDSVTPWGLTQTFILVGVVTWMGLGGYWMDGHREGSAKP